MPCAVELALARAGQLGLRVCPPLPVLPGPDLRVYLPESLDLLPQPVQLLDGEDLRGLHLLANIRIQPQRDTKPEEAAAACLHQVRFLLHVSLPAHKGGR